MPPPPTNQTFSTPEDAIKSINSFTGPHGYALTKKCTKNDKLGNLKTITSSVIVAAFIGAALRKEIRRETGLHAVVTVLLMQSFVFQKSFMLGAKPSP